MAAFLYPVALDVSGRRCVVVGGGAVGGRKAAGLWEAGASVVVVAPELREAKLRELVAAGSVKYVEVPFMPTHLDHAFLAIAATDNARVNTAVAAAARARGVLLNHAADAEGGDFATMATVRRGDLVVALTTGGAGPALTARLRRELDGQFGPEWAAYTALLGEMRTLAQQTLPDPQARTVALRRLAEREAVRELLARGETDAARQEALDCLS